MADEFDPDAYLANKQAQSFDPDAYLASKRGQQGPTEPHERGVLERAGSATAETFKAGVEHAGKAFSPPRTVHKLPGSLAEAGEQLLDPETYKQGGREALENLKDTGLGLLSPLTMTAGALTSGAASLLASGQAGAQRLAQKGIKKSAEALAPESRLAKAPVQSSEEAYEKALPGAEAALMAVGPKVPKGGGLARPIRTKPARGDEAEAGQIIEQLATDPAKVQRTLESPPPEIVPGSQPTTHQLTADYGLGQAERAAKTRDYAPFHQREAQQNAARIKALQDAQAGGSAEEISTALRDIARANQQAADEAVRLAEQRAWETTRRMGGERDATTYGEVLRQELRNAEEAVRAEERLLWEQVDPGGRLRANPQPLQELERSIYGVMPEGGAAEASLTAAEQKVAGVIQNYRNIIPYQELRDLRHLVNTELREELIASGQSPAYARLSRLRQGIADMEGRAFDETGVLDAEASARLRGASTATRERYEEFGRGSVGQVLARQGSQGPFRVGEAAVPEKFIRPGAKGHDTASEFLRASPGSLAEFQDAVAASARREVINPDGTINPRRLEGWLKRYQDTLRAIDERDGGAFSQGLRNLRTAQETLTAAQERQALVREQNERGMFGQLLGSVDEADITRRVGTVFGGVDRVARARQLRSMVAGNPAAEAGLRRSVVDHITERFLGTMEVGEGQTGLRASMFQKFVRENQAVLRQLMTPEQVNTLDAIAADLQQATRQYGTKMKGSSNTAQDIFNQARQAGMLSKLGETALHWAIGKKLGKPGKLVYDAITGVVARGRDKDFERIQRMIDRAMLEPEYARQLLSKTRVQRRPSLTPVIPAGAADNAADFKPQHPSPGVRQAGGGVPAIGGTGGRSPGARASTEARKVLPGTGQTLADGGEAGDQQAAASVGGRERFAAALQGHPTGAGFNVGGEQRAKPKAPKSASREDIRRTLQSFGITGEEAGGFSDRQLGEVDSRAYGGGVDDPPGGERAPIHYDPGDDTTFGARFGQWDKTATGKSLPRDDEDVDATILVPGQKMIHGGGYEGERGRAGYYETRGMAEGGEVDRWDKLPSSRNVEDRRDEEPLTAGQLIAGNQAFMGRYPSPYTRAPRRAVTAEARKQGGTVEPEERRDQYGRVATTEPVGPVWDTRESEALKRRMDYPPNFKMPMYRAEGGEIGPELPDALMDQTRSYLADQLGGVEREHEKQDPHEALIEAQGGRRKAHPSDGASDQGYDPFEAAAARTRRRAPVREPDAASLAASQGKVSWGDYGRHKLEQGIKTVTAPGRAYKDGMTDDEMIEAAQSMSGLMGGARFPGAMAGKVEGSLGTFGGRNAKTADLDALAWATKKRAEGAPRASIWNQTGWWRMPDAQWAFEIPDRGSFVKPTPTYQPIMGGASRPGLIHQGELGDVLHHPELYKAYPELARIPTEVKLGTAPGGGYSPPDMFANLLNPGSTRDLGRIQVSAPKSVEHPKAREGRELNEEITPWRVLLHETTHGLQHTQEPTWGQGGNPRNLPYTERQITNMAKKEALEAGVPWWALRPIDQTELEGIIRKQEYMRLWGEMLPRMVEKRRHNELGQRPPWEDLDLPWDKNIRIHRNDAVAAGFRPPKGKSPWKRPEKFAEGGEIDEPGEAQAAREAAALRTQRGARPREFSRSGREEGPVTSFLDSALPVWMRANAEKALHYPEAAKALGSMAATIPERMSKAGSQLATLPQERLEKEFDPSGPGDLAMLGLAGRMPVRAAPGEVVLGAGRTRPPTPPRSHNLPPGEEPLPLERRVSSLSLRDMPIDKAIETAKTEQHLIPSRAKEGFVGAPNWVKTPEDLARLRANFDAQVERGLLGAKWYEEAQGGIKEMAPGDPRRQHQLSQELAVTSAQSTPDTNLGFALQGHNAIMAGKPLPIVRTGQQAETLRKGHAAGEMQLGRKTGIYARHMDPTMEDPSTGTNDIWHARALGYGDKVSSLSAAQHAFMDAETVLAVARANERKLGGRSDWTPGEIQAAPWVAGKAEGLQEQFGWSPERSMAEAIKTYPQHFDKYTAFGTHEATPGVGVGHLPQIATGTEAERAAFAEHPASTWKDPQTGEDIMYRGAGMYTRPTLKATGIFEGPEGLEINPAEVARPMVSFTGKAGSRELGPAERAQMTGVEAARAYIDAQNAGAWSALVRGQKTGDSRSVYIPRSGPPAPLPLGDVKQLLAIGGRHGLPGVIDYGQGTALTSFGGEGAATGKQVATGLRKQGDRQPDMFGNANLGQELRSALPGTEPGPVKLDTGYIDYSGKWGAGEGSGAVTRELQTYLRSKEAPALIARLDADPSIRMAVADRIHRDIQLAERRGMPIREDLMRARQIIVEDGFAGLFAALKRGVALPAAAVVPALELLRQLQGQEQPSGG